MDIFKIFNDDMSGLTEEEKFYAEKFNTALKEAIIDGLVIYEGNEIIKNIKNDEEAFREKMELIFTNGLKGYKNMPIKTLIDIYIDRCGEEAFINLIQNISNL